MFDIFSLLIGFIPLYWGANILVDGSTSIVKKTGVSNFFIGLTIITIGTSSPELSVNVFAALKHDNFITMGNVLGSNMFNVALILGLVALIVPVIIKSSAVRVETISVFLVAVVLLVLSHDKIFFNSEYNVITRKEGLGLLALFFVYFLFLVKYLLKKNHREPENNDPERQYSGLKIIMGLGLLIAGGQLIVYSAQNLSDYLNISERIVALIFISAGTSLPELATAIVAVRKGNTELIYGNLVGSNIFNGLFVLGASAVINPIRISQGIFYDLIIHLVISSLLLLFLISKPPMLKKVNGSLLILLYFSYLFYLFVLMN